MNVTPRRFSILAAVFFCCVVAIGGGFEARADGQEYRGDDFSLYLGYMLPNQIDHVTEILPVFGGRYAFALPLGALEFEASNTHATGVDFTNFGISLRGNLPIGPGLEALIYGGPDFNYYRPEGSDSRQSEYGLHLGVAGLVLINDSLWARADLKFMGNPGTSLYLLFGLMFRSPGQ